MRLVSRTRLLPAYVAVMLALPASAAAQSTGGASAPEPQPRFAGSVTLVASSHALLGRKASLTGTVRRAARGRTVRLQRYDEAARRWRTEARAVVGRTGRFHLRWKPRALGEQRVRATLQRRRAATVTSASPELSVRVFKPAMATWYGPGLYGNRTACGQKLTRALVGVAHKKLPCGTLVEVSYRGASVIVPVIDRGPFVKGKTWDLTSAAAERLGFTGTARIGALVQSR